jgi:hypothetical protein
MEGLVATKASGNTFAGFNPINCIACTEPNCVASLHPSSSNMIA